jgi:hypothetical protein
MVIASTITFTSANVPPKSDPIWHDIVSGKTKFALDFLAAKIMLGRLTYQVKNDPTPKTIEECAQAIHDVYAENTNLPSVQIDLNLMFNGGKS